MSNKTSKRFSEFDDWSQDADRKAKKKSRWGNVDESENPVLAGLPTVVPQGLTKEQEELYLLQLQIEEITRRLRTGELGIPPNPEDRSPSPEPFYNNEGKRLNTRDYRTRKKLEEERHGIILKVQKLNPDYKAPADYRPPLTRISDRVQIPQDEHPEINFVGLLIGPRGNTLRSLEKETGTSIIIRGKGSVKEGKVGHKDGRPLPGQDEPLHAYITAGNPENVKKAAKRIKEIIEEGINVPDADNDLRKQQLRELALLNGTLREGDALSKLKQFQESQTIITNTILCAVCGGAGHISADCKQRRPGDSLKAAAALAAGNPMLHPTERAKMDSEYMSLMAELGQGNAPPAHPNHLRTRLSLQAPTQPKLQITGSASTSTPWSSLPVNQPTLAPPPIPPPALSVGQSRPNSLGPLSLPPPVCPPVLSSWQQSTPTVSSATANNSTSWGNTQSASTGISSWGNSNSTGGTSSWGNTQSSSSWSNAPPPSVGRMGTPQSWGNTQVTNQWTGGAAANQGGGGSQWRASQSGWGSAPMSGPPVPPTPPSFYAGQGSTGGQYGGGARGSLVPPPPPPH